MDWNILGEIISQLGFPIFVAIYFMFRVEATFKELSKTLDKFNENMIKNNEILNKIFDYFISNAKGDENNARHNQINSF